MKTMHHFLHPSKPIHSPPTPPSLHSNLNHTLDSWIDFSDCSHESDPITLHDLNPFNKPSSPSNHALNSIQSHDWVHQTPDLSQPLHQNLQFKPLNTILASSPTSSISNSSTLTSSLDSHPILNLSPTSQPLSVSSSFRFTLLFHSLDLISILLGFNRLSQTIKMKLFNSIKSSLALRLDWLMISGLRSHQWIHSLVKITHPHHLILTQIQAPIKFIHFWIQAYSSIYPSSLSIHSRSSILISNP